MARRFARVVPTAALLLVMATADAFQAPPASGQPPATPQPRPAPPGPQRRTVQVMTLTSTAWPDGGRIPAKYTQAGAEVSPPLAWSQVPEGTASFVLIVRDLDSAVASGPDEVLHWLLWNVPGTARSLAEGYPQGSQQPDGTRQTSVSGPYYRGPGAPAGGPPHHYTIELYALDATLDVPAVGQSPAQTRAAVLAAMAGKVRGKGAYVGLFNRE